MTKREVRRSLAVLLVCLCTACGQSAPQEPVSEAAETPIISSIPESNALSETQEALDALEGRIDVTIELVEERAGAEEAEAPVAGETEAASNETEVSEVKIKITAGGAELTATLENNVTTQALLEQMPMTLPMMDLYGREMCYRYGAYALPTEQLRSDGYEVGDIAYWAPGGSLVILYAQNGEQFERQHLGRIEQGVEIFSALGDVDVTFERVE